MSILGDIIKSFWSAISGGMTTAQLGAALDKRAAGKNLNWRESIVDLMKLTGQDSSLSARKALAKELGYTGRLNGSAEMNIWLHGEVMRRLAKQGLVPK